VLGAEAETGSFGVGVVLDEENAPAHHRIGEVSTMKILLAVDGSEYTKRMLAYLAAHDELLGPGHEYTALTVVTPVPPHAARHLDRGTIDDYYRDEAI
jgi:hypothetical protein